MTRKITLQELVQIGRTIRDGDPYARATIVASAVPIPDYPDDLVAVVRYRTRRVEGYAWALVQKVGPVWSATLKLTATDAARRALVAVGKDPDDQPEEAQMEGRTDGAGAADSRPA